MLDLDPPAHTRQRRLVSRAFTPRRVEALRPAVGRMVEGLVDRLADAGEADVMRELAFPLPVTVIGELMGVPEADRAGFQPLVRDAAATLEVAVDDETWARARRARATMASYFRDLMAERRARPGDDLLTALVSAPERDDRLGEPEVVATTLLLFGAGFETTTNLIGNGLLALLRHPQEAGRLGADPSRELVASTVEELLRWDSPVQLDGRMALEEVVVAGHHLVPGDVVLTLLGSANRDPARFVDPERLDLCRTDGGPISFGGGIHYCLGAGLARMEGQVVFGTLARRFAAIELAEEPEWRSGLTLRGLSSLRVRVRSH
jgi:cytochrome P450